MMVGAVICGMSLSGPTFASCSALHSCIAQAAPVPAPLYHWCPGDFWDPGWGFNWEWLACHDDWHRDIDGDWHDHDWHPDWNDRHRDDWDNNHRDDNGPWQPWQPWSPN